jgi:hypothetical protein
VSLNGWSVQYASATGTGSWSVTPLTNFTLQPGQYYLVQEDGNANGINTNPAADATGSIAMAQAAGKVLVASTTTAFTGCPSGTNVIDLVGYGTTANCSETSAAPAPSTTTADLRAAGGCTDTNNNSADFAAGAPNPRNTLSPLNKCVVPIVTSCPAPITALQGSTVSAPVSGTDPDGTVTSATIPVPAVAGTQSVSILCRLDCGGTATATPEISQQHADRNYRWSFSGPNKDSRPPGKLIHCHSAW